MTRVMALFILPLFQTGPSCPFPAVASSLYSMREECWDYQSYKGVWPSFVNRFHDTCCAGVECVRRCYARRSARSSRNWMKEGREKEAKPECEVEHDMNRSLRGNRDGRTEGVRTEEEINLDTGRGCIMCFSMHADLRNYCLWGKLPSLAENLIVSHLAVTGFHASWGAGKSFLESPSKSWSLILENPEHEVALNSLPEIWSSSVTTILAKRHMKIPNP